MDTIAAWVVLLAFITVISIAILSVWLDVMEDVRKDKKWKNTVMARRIADRMFDEYVRNIEYRIYQKSTVVVDNTETTQTEVSKGVLM